MAAFISKNDFRLCFPRRRYNLHLINISEPSWKKAIEEAALSVKDNEGFESPG